MTYHPYTEWEDWKAGMYEPSTDPDAVQASFVLLTNPSALTKAMRSVTQVWPLATDHNMTDRGSNRRSWLGQSACCLVHGATERATCSAWWAMTAEAQNTANKVADKIIAEWDRRHAQTLFT